ncbi:hypothetical protein CY35_05G133100 [Sphagnum magellanicum]|nr:hypothetical protein CY35_05G133100 [Sphagnum magellanicum]
MDGITRARLLESFVPTLDSSEDAGDAGNVSWYAITVTNTKQFQLVVTQVIMETKEVLGIGSIGSCSEGIVSRYARFICAMNLQCIAELLRQCWAFSVALDMATHMATHMATSYCDVCICICHKSTVHDFHLLFILVHERHAGEIIFNTFAKAMDALFPDWRETIIGASSDGEKKMTGRHQGVITRIHRVAKLGFMRSFYLAIPDTFYSTFTLLVAYLCRQQNFISDERSQCPLICDTRWLNMIKVTIWFDQHRLAVVVYLEEKKLNCMLDNLWWILMLFVHEIAGIAAISCKSLQRHGALLCNQHHTLKHLAQHGAIDEATHQLSDSSDYAVAFATVNGCMEDLGMFVKDRLSAMDNGHRETLLRLSTSAILELERLDYTFSNEEIENIGRQHKAFSIDSFDDSAAYRDAWTSLHNTYPLLEKFVGGLATIFPGTSTVESDFSVVKYEKNKNRMSLTDASLKGILHAKQYRRMHNLKV